MKNLLALSRIVLAVTLPCQLVFAVGDVRFVDDDGPADFADIQAAVDASATGDTIVVLPGPYSGFTVESLGLTIIGVPVADVAGEVRVRFLAPDQVTVLSNLRVQGVQSRALVLEENSGAVTVQSCELVGRSGGWHCDYDLTTAAVLVEVCQDTFFIDCTIRGGDGGQGWCLESVADDGAEGARITDSHVAFYDCSLEGGDGGWTYSTYYGNYAGDGGAGCEASGNFLFASNTDFRGGRGGAIECNDVDIGYAGNGGHGLEFLIGAFGITKLLDDSMLGGPGGEAFGSSFICWPGDPGQGIHDPYGTMIEMLPGTSRSMKVEPWGIAGETVQVAFNGLPGDVVYLPSKAEPGFTYEAPLQGVWQLETPVSDLGDPVGIVPASGVFRTELVLPDLAPSQSSSSLFLQAYFVDGASQPILGSAGCTLVLEGICSAESYCTSAPHSAGPGAEMSASGSTSVAANDLVLISSGGIPEEFGLFFYGPTRIETPFGDGFLCVGAPLTRLIPPICSDPAGTTVLALDFTQPPMDAGAGAVESGVTWNFQHWFRDPASVGSGFNTSNALRVTFCP